MKISLLGIILALKNLGTWIMVTWQYEAVRNNPHAFLWGLMIFAIINIPSDLYLANHISEQGLKKSEK